MPDSVTPSEGPLFLVIELDTEDVEIEGVVAYRNLQRAVEGTIADYAQKCNLSTTRQLDMHDDLIRLRPHYFERGTKLQIIEVAQIKE